MEFGKFHFGKIEIDGVNYERDVVIDRGRIRKRKKKPSKRFREEFGHTPVSVEEEIPWKCQRLVVGTGRYGSLPVMDEVKLGARRGKVVLLILPAEEAIETLANQPKRTNAILHVTCWPNPRCLARASLTTLSASSEPLRKGFQRRDFTAVATLSMRARDMKGD